MPVFSVARRRRRKGTLVIGCMPDHFTHCVYVCVFVSLCVCVFIYFTFFLIIRSSAPTSFFKICFNFPPFYSFLIFSLLLLSFLVIFLIFPFFLHNSSLPRRSCLSSNNEDRVLEVQILSGACLFFRAVSPSMLAQLRARINQILHPFFLLLSTLLVYFSQF